jgi:hypothetical protein
MPVVRYERDVRDLARQRREVHLDRVRDARFELLGPAGAGFAVMPGAEREPVRLLPQREVHLPAHRVEQPEPAEGDALPRQPVVAEVAGGLRVAECGDLHPQDGQVLVPFDGLYLDPERVGGVLPDQPFAHQPGRGGHHRRGR